MPPKRTKKQQTKISKKKTEFPINSHVVNNVLPQMSNADLVNYFTNAGPEGWKNGVDQMDSADVKKMILLLINRTSLVEQLSVFLTFYEDRNELLVPFYELGLGGWLRQLSADSNYKNTFLQLVAKEAQPNCVFPILPLIDEGRHYFCLNRNFAKTNALSLNDKLKRIDPRSMSLNDLYFAKLCSTLTCAKLQRWSESFAHALSALDCWQDNPYLHHLFCYIALAANNMSVSLKWTLDVLDLAYMHGKSIDEQWVRYIVLQNCLLKNGHYGLETKLYNLKQDIFVACNNYHQVFHIQHLLCLLAHVEENLVFQYLRQNFHQDCQVFCNKPVFLEKTFEATGRVLSRMDAIIVKLHNKGLREYFRGYFYLYSSMTDVFKHHVDNKTSFMLNLALHNFNLAQNLWSQNNQDDALYLDLLLMVKYLNKQTFTMQYVTACFSNQTNVKNNAGASHFLFKMMLVAMYWGTLFQSFPLSLLATSARCLESKVTNNKSYRKQLLAACQKMANVPFTHVVDGELDDFPLLVETDEKRAEARLAFDFINQEQEPYMGDLPILPTADELIRKETLAEEVYAFGVQISEACTTLE